MSKVLSGLSDTEWQIMKICWKSGQSSARVIYEETLKQKSRGYQTVKTMLDRLVKKGYLKREKFGPIWLYTPIVSRTKVVAKEVDFFMNNVLDNTFTPLLSFLTKKETLSDEEIEALEKLIEANKKGKAK